MSKNHWIVPEGTSAGVTVKENADGSFDVTGTSTDEAGISASVYTLKPGTEYTVSANKLVSTAGSSSDGCLAVQFYEDGARKSFKNFAHSEASQTVTLTSPSSFDYATCMFYTGSAGNDFDLTGMKVMLNEGGTAEPWVPSGDLPPEETGETGYGVKAMSISLADLGQCIASRSVGSPEKKSVTKTVPYMSGFYDFSKVYGAVAYESRELAYSVDIIGEDRADLQDQRGKLLAWASSVHDADIWDEDFPGRHFHGSYSGSDWEETEDGEAGTLEITFLCQPFLIDDDSTTAQCAVGTTTVTNDGEAVNPTAAPSDGTATVKINGAAQQISAETRLSIQLAPGDNEVEVSGSDVTLKWLRATL